MCKSDKIQPAGGRLETNANTVRRSKARDVALVSQRFAAKILGNHRVRNCRWAVRSVEKGVDIVEKQRVFTDKNGNQKQGRSAAFEGLQSCGSVWICPCCSDRISRRRRDEMNQMLSWARANKYGVWMVTLTARHGKSDRLADLLDKLKDAKQRLVRHRAYSKIKDQIIGTITATEVTAGGANGWHPHFHMIVITRKRRTDLSALQDIWLASLEGAGLSGTGDGFDIRSASATGKYIAKWGAAEELALSHHKTSKKGKSRTPFELLADAALDGDELAKGLWLEFAHAFAIDKRRNQLVWSRGLKALVGVDEKSDEEAADEAELPAADIKVNMSHADWKRVACKAHDKRGKLLDLVEQHGAVVAVENFIAGNEVIEDEINTVIERESASPTMQRVHAKARERQDTLDGLRRARLNSIKYQLEMNFVYESDLARDTTPEVPPTAQVPPEAAA